MNKSASSFSIFLTALMFIISISGISVYSRVNGEHADKKHDNKIVIAHSEIFETLERPQVLFDHEKHAEAFKQEGCKICHALDERERLIFDFPKGLKKKNNKSVMDAYHDACINCHREQIKKKEKAGPIICAECHAKELETVKVEYPIVSFDFAYHDKHIKKLEDDCSHCHHIYDLEEEDEELALVYEEGTEESCYYCHDLKKKRGPKLAEIVRIAAKKGLTMEKASHQQCLNCHMKYIQRDEDAGPVVCSKCHTGKYKTVAELSEFPRPKRDQPEDPFIHIEDAKMKGIPFDHASHEKTNTTCRVCHHETLKACKECHSLLGKPEGDRVTIANAYHDVLSEESCAGCHAIKKAENDCAGCHHHLLDMDVQTQGPKKAVCSICHSGKKKKKTAVRSIPITALAKEKVPEEVTIKILEKEYEPSSFPHVKIIKKLVEISNESKMATYFHRDMKTICKGCHHQSEDDAEAEKNKPPFCRNCHSLAFDKQNLNKPRLLAVYHRQCIGCHEQMALEKPRKCKECHEEKEKRPTDILQGFFYKGADDVYS